MSIFGKSYGTGITGHMMLKGKEVNLKNVKEAIKNKLAYVTEDRKGNGLVLNNPIKINTTLANLDAVSAKSIIDKDKVELGYIKECALIAQSRHLTLLKHTVKPQFLITVAPAIDRFILDSAHDSGIDPDDYGIPSELKQFTEVSKSVTSNTDPRFKALFAALKDSREVSTLRNVLRYLSEKKYNANVEALKQLFEGINDG